MGLPGGPPAHLRACSPLQLQGGPSSRCELGEGGSGKQVRRAGPCLSPAPKQTGGQPDLPDCKFMCKITSFSDFRRPAVLVVDPALGAELEVWGGWGSGREAQRAPFPGVAVGRGPRRCVRHQSPVWAILSPTVVPLWHAARPGGGVGGPLGCGPHPLPLWALIVALALWAFLFAAPLSPNTLHQYSRRFNWRQNTLTIPRHQRTGAFRFGGLPGRSRRRGRRSGVASAPSGTRTRCRLIRRHVPGG